MADHNKLKSALKTMCSAPDEIRAADDAYKAKLKELEKYTDTYSPALMRKEKGEARDRRNRVIDNLMGQMETAVQTIAANNEFDSEKLDITDPKLQAAINAVALAGRGLDVDSQLSILEQFRGNPAALKFLGAAFKEKGLYFADRAQEMVRPIPKNAIEDAARFIGTYQYSGEIDNSIMVYTRGEFRKQAQRMGFDLDDEPSVYVRAINDELRKLSDKDCGDDPKAKARITAKRLALQKAAGEIKEATSNGGNPGDILAKAIASVEALDQAK